jgi:hypothetical protein
MRTIDVLAQNDGHASSPAYYYPAEAFLPA